MKIIIDMNLTPLWVPYLEAEGFHAHHWSTLGNPKASDRDIMAHARQHNFVVFSHDLDFGNILAVTHAIGPSVLQVRTQDPLPEVIGTMVLAALHEHRLLIERGALITIEPDRSRARVLPIIPGNRRS